MKVFFKCILMTICLMMGSVSMVLASESDIILKAYQNSDNSLIIIANDPVGKGYIGDLTVKIWSAINGQDDAKSYLLSYSGGKYQFTVNISEHNNDKGIYYMELYGSSGLLKSDFTTIAVNGNEWIQYKYEGNGNFSAMTCRSMLDIEPTIIKKSTEEANSAEDFKSGYGYATTFKTKVTSNIEVDAEKALTGAGNARIIFPEFNFRDGATINETYGQYDRLTDCTNRNQNSNIAQSQLELKTNPFSASEKRVHFTPIWYPDNLDYTVYSEVIDAWTPGGMLSTPITEKFRVDGNVYDDWQINQQR